MNRRGYNFLDAILHLALSAAAGVLFGVFAGFQWGFGFGVIVGLLVWDGTGRVLNILVMSYFTLSVADVLEAIYGPGGVPDEFMAGPLKMVQNAVREKLEERYRRRNDDDYKQDLDKVRTTSVFSADRDWSRGPADASTDDWQADPG